MEHAIRLHRTGGPEVLQYEDVDVGDPGPGEVRIRHAAVGLNFADTYFRNGLYPAPVPCGLGVEASGVVDAIGTGVTNVAAGDRVTYTGSPLGAYSTARIMPAASLIRLPAGIACETAAAMTMRGLTAGYLLRSIVPLKSGDTILFHAAAGGVGLIACQWARALGVTMIGTVGSDEKAGGLSQRTMTTEPQSCGVAPAGPGWLTTTSAKSITTSAATDPRAPLMPAR